ncbi:MAG: hypothetical protein OIF32_10870 [Campylobacterales bacterium]|nr:hypothetical protein [Campylobacterales bacterium]
MYKRELETLLQNGGLPRSIMLFGDCDYDIEYYTKKILEQKAGHNPSMLKLYFGEFNLQSGKTHLAESSLFGDTNVLIVKTDKKIDTKSLKELNEVVSRNQSSLFILHYHAEDGKAKSKAFNTKGQSANVRFFKPNFGEAMTTLKRVAGEKGISVSNDVLSHILNMHSLNISLAVTDLEKIEILGSEATNNDALAMITGQQEADLFGLCEALITNQPFATSLARILQEGESEVQIVSGINNIFLQLFMFNSCAKINGHADSKDFLGYKLPGPIEQRRAGLSLKIKEHHYQNILLELNNLELILKTDSKIEKKALLLSTLITIQNRLLS